MHIILEIRLQRPQIEVTIRLEINSMEGIFGVVEWFLMIFDEVTVITSDIDSLGLIL